MRSITSPATILAGFRPSRAGDMCYTLCITVRFEWDEEKDAANQRKHGVDFESAARVFADPDYVLREDRTDEGGEMLWHAIGLVEAVLLLVVHVYRSSIDGEEIIRIISARRTRKQERRGYFQ